jgi:dTDP-4-amino-4,6-dideoxygalactose transaminase
MIKIEDYNNPFDAIIDFEKAVGEYTGAPYVVTTDCCSHAIELSFRYIQSFAKNGCHVTLPKHTYISVPMVFHILGIPYDTKDIEWEAEYQIQPTLIWDSARRFDSDMYRRGQMQCVSFGKGKPLEVGRGGAILLDNKEACDWLKRASYDGRDLGITPWQNQTEFRVGYHYMMRPEECIIGLNLITNNKITHELNHVYPDISKINVS